MIVQSGLFFRWLSSLDYSFGDCPVWNTLSIIVQSGLLFRWLHSLDYSFGNCPVWITLSMIVQSGLPFRWLSRLRYSFGNCPVWIISFDDYPVWITLSLIVQSGLLFRWLSSLDYPLGNCPVWIISLDDCPVWIILSMIVQSGLFCRWLSSLDYSFGNCPVWTTLSVFTNFYLYPVDYWYFFVFSSWKNVTVWKKMQLNCRLHLTKRVRHLVQETHLKYVERREIRDSCHYTVSYSIHSTNYSRSSVYIIVFLLYAYLVGVLF